MNTSLFSNMFKNLFGTQITPTASQFVPMTASDGTPAGISSMANLISFLGGKLVSNYINNSTTSYTLSSLDYGIYTFGYANNITDAPSDVASTSHGAAVLIFKISASKFIIYIDSDISGAWKKLGNENWVKL